MKFEMINSLEVFGAFLKYLLVFVTFGQTLSFPAPVAELMLSYPAASQLIFHHFLNVHP